MCSSSDAPRLQVYLAHRGVASRRSCADIIRSGRVEIDGRIVLEPGLRVASNAQVSVDGTEIPQRAQALRTIVLNKPRGYICSNRRQSTDAKLVYDILGGFASNFPYVGRLDKDSEGLLIFSNDGNLAQMLTHPSHGHKKEYRVSVRGSVTKAQLATLSTCRQLDEDSIQPVFVDLLTRSRDISELKFVLQEGRNRQIRRMCELVNLRILNLRRTAIGCFRDASLETGKWRELSAPEIKKLLA